MKLEQYVIVADNSLDIVQWTTDGINLVSNYDIDYFLPNLEQKHPRGRKQLQWP